MGRNNLENLSFMGGYNGNARFEVSRAVREKVIEVWNVHFSVSKLRFQRSLSTSSSE
jgi:hypothetical protein